MTGDGGKLSGCHWACEGGLRRGVMMRTLPQLTCLLLLWLGAGCGGARHGDDAPERVWLTTDDNERCGVALVSDLTRDAGAWDVRGVDQPSPGDAPPALAPVADLAERELAGAPGVAVNGGFWNEHGHAVGVCAGAQGIYSTLPHPSGIALAGGRAVCGSLYPRVRLWNVNDDRTTRPLAGLEHNLALNPHPLPQQTPYLIDPRTYPWDVQPVRASRVWWLEPLTTGALKLNSTRRLRVARADTLARQAVAERPPAGTLLLIAPERGAKDDAGHAGAAPELQPGERLALELTLEGVPGPVRWATCAGPRLLRQGKVVGGLDARRDTRTAIGCDAAGRHLIVVLLTRGRQGQTGATLEELAAALKKLGASDAINLDGGSSTSIYARPADPALEVMFPAKTPVHHALILRRTLTKNPSQP
jgi:hypothetical protein